MFLTTAAPGEFFFGHIPETANGRQWTVLRLFQNDNIIRQRISRRNLFKVIENTVKSLLKAVTAILLRRAKQPATSPEQERRRQIIESDYGRMGGWYVEHNGRRIAALAEPQWEDMFWVSYAIEPLTEDAEERRQLLETDAFWLTEFVYRSKQFGEVADNAMPALHPFISPGRVNMRGLYLTIDT
ncbi:MAG: hypothetical protein LBU06_06240 [Desulfovibrio sp.]|jgi:hypothetical protein|nr:hypothetical protein [Desulfovibrio sp.]